MPPRPPPKISLKHEWTRKLGSKVVRQPQGKLLDNQKEKLLDKQKFSNQPNPLPIQFVTRPCDLLRCKIKKPQKINVDSFNEELSFSDRTGRPVVSEDRKSLNVKSRHMTERSDLLLLFMQLKQKTDFRIFSVHDNDTINVDDEVLRERMEKSIAVHDENHEPMMVNEADMDFRIPGLPLSVVKHAQSTSVRELIQKIENHPNRHAFQQYLLQKKLFNLSLQNQKMILDVGNIELCQLLETEPKTQCKVCLSYWNIGIFYCTCGHFLRKGKGKSEIHQFHDGPSFSPKIRRQEKTTSWTSIYGRKQRNKAYHTANQLKKKCKKKFFQGIHDRFIRDPNFRNRMIVNHRDEKLCRKWDALSDKHHTHHLTSQEYFLHKSNWWLHSNKQGSNIVPVTHRPEFKQALSTLPQLKQNSRRSLTSAHVLSQKSKMDKNCWNLQDSWRTPYSHESHDGDKQSTEKMWWPVDCKIKKNSSLQDFLEFVYFVRDGSFTTDGCLL